MNAVLSFDDLRYVLALIGFSQCDLTGLKVLLHAMCNNLFIRAEKIPGALWTPFLAQLPPCNSLSCFTCFALLERYNGAVTARDMTPDQVHEYVCLLATVVSNIGAIFELCGDFDEARKVVVDFRHFLSEPAPEEERRHEWEWEPVSLPVRTPIPSILDIMANHGTLALQPLPTPTAPSQSQISKIARQPEIALKIRKLLGLREMIRDEDVHIIVLLLWKVMVNHGPYGDLQTPNALLHSDIVPFEGLLIMAPTEPRALLLLQLLIVRVLSELGYARGPEEDDDIETLAPLPSLMTTPTNIEDCMNMILNALEQMAQRTASAE